MSDCDLPYCSCGCTSIQLQNHHRSSSVPRQQLKDGTSSAVNVGLVPSSNKEQVGLPAVESSSSSKSADNTCVRSSSPVGRRGGGSDTAPSAPVEKEGDTATDSASSLLVPLPGEDNSFGSKSNSAPSHPNPEVFTSCRDCVSKMFSCRVLIVLLLVKCLILSFIIPAHLVPTSSSEHPAQEYDGGNGNGNGDSHHPAGDEDGFDNNIMLDDQPLSLTLKTEIMNLVEPFDLPSQAVTPPDTTDNGDVEAAAAEDSNGGNGDSSAASNGANGGGNGHEANGDGTTEAADDDGDTGAESTTDANGDDDGDGDGDGDKDGDGDDDKKDDDGADSQGEDTGEAAAETTEASTGAASSEGSASGESGGDGDSCSSGDASMKTVLEKIESLMDAVKNIDSSIDKMETLVQSTMIDERVYKCMSAISNGNQTQALKYWKQILRYVSTPQKQAAILNQLIRDSYGGSQDQIIPVIQFIDQTTQYYGYHTLFKELPKYNHLYRNTAVFTLGHYIKKACGRDSALYKSLPGAVQSVFADFFTLQNKHNKGYLYYAKRCVSKHYFHCLDVLTKRIDPYVLDGLADDSEEKKRYHWKLNATDTTANKFFILNHDKYWTYRLQDLNNSPRFKMEEAGSNAEVDLAHFQLKLHSDDELMIQVRDSEDYLEEEDFKSDKAEVRLHSFHQAAGIPDSPRMYWLANPVTSASSSSDDDDDEPDGCNMELSSVAPANGNGNGSSK